MRPDSFLAEKGGGTLSSYLSFCTLIMAKSWALILVLLTVELVFSRSVSPRDRKSISSDILNIGETKLPAAVRYADLNPPDLVAFGEPSEVLATVWSPLLGGCSPLLSGTLPSCDRNLESRSI